MNPIPDPDFLAAMRRVCFKPVIFQSQVGDVFVLVSFLQLALRHPSMQTCPPESVRVARDFIANFREQVAEGEPAIAELIDMGFEPEHDR